jgi:Flp pilus assembly protein TadD
VDDQALNRDQRSALTSALQELVSAEMIDSDRPEAHLNLGLLETRLQQPADAEAQYLIALRLDPAFVPALVNLADLDRMRGMDQQGDELLRKAMSIEPTNAAIPHSLGLLLVRQHRYTEALGLLRQASELAPDDTRYAYVYAIALNSTGARAEAMALLERVHLQHPTDQDVLLALVSLARNNGDFSVALRHARELATLSPMNAQIHALVSDLEKQQAR